LLKKSRERPFSEPRAMFWKKPAPPPAEAPPSTRAPSSDADDAALDTVVRLLQSFGEHAFDTDSATAIDTRGQCEGWAKRLSVGEGRGNDGADKEFRRDFSGARRYFAAQRVSEREYVGRSLGNLREAVQAFARCLTTSVSSDRTADQRVGTELGKLVGAFQSNDPAWRPSPKATRVRCRRAHARSRSALR
jgi:hypothetical protein